jgi:hypothetical protein
MAEQRSSLSCITLHKQANYAFFEKDVGKIAKIQQRQKLSVTGMTWK